MKRFLLFALLSASAFGQSVQQSTSQLGTTGNWVVAFQWTASGAGTVPITAWSGSGTSGPGCCQGYLIVQVETVPLSPAPTSGYSVQITDAAGVDALGGAAASLSAISPQSFAAAASAPPIQGSFNLVITGQSVSGAKGTVFVFLSKPGTVNLAKINGGGGGGGGNSANWLTIANVPFVDPRRYNFAAQSPGGSLSVGSNTITLRPGPIGVKASASNYSLYISGGTGTAEGALVTGGTCNGSGQPSCTVIVTCANTHSGAWTIQSATSGIKEAMLSTPAPAFIWITDGTYPIYATISVTSGYRIGGQSRLSTILQVFAATETAVWQSANTSYGVFTASSADSIDLGSLTIDENNNTVHLSAFSSTGVTNSRLHDIAVKNPWEGGLFTLFNMLNTTASDNNLIDGNYFYMGSGCSDNNGPGAVNLNNTFRTRVVNNYAEGGCASSFTAANAANSGDIFSGNVFNLASGTMSEGNQAYTADSASGVIFTGNYCTGNGTGPACFTTTADGGPTQPDNNDNTFVGNFAYNCGFAFEITGGPTGHTAKGNIIDGNITSGCFNGVLLTPGNPSPGNIVSTTISNNTFDASQNLGIAVQSTTLGATLVGTVIKGNQIINNGASGIQFYQIASGLVSNVVIANNFINHNVTAGIIVNPSSGFPINDVTISGNTITDTAGSPVQSFDLLFNTTDTYSRYIITGNNLAGSTGVSWPNSNDITKMATSQISNNICSASNCSGMPNALAYYSPVAFASLGSVPAAGFSVFCKDCTTAATCAGSGGGHMAVSNGTNWTCQ